MPDKQKAMNRGRAKKGTFGRIIKSLFRYYPVLSTVMLICIIFSSAVSSIPALFMQRIFDALTELPAGSSWLDIKDY
ncbi:MAG: hypothetical protein IJR83_05865, partial [Clostridia bacterium]|nr:hypothetical protein [Clostridia bacterium]